MLCVKWHELLNHTTSHFASGSTLNGKFNVKNIQIKTYSIKVSEQ